MKAYRFFSPDDLVTKGGLISLTRDAMSRVSSPP